MNNDTEEAPWWAARKVLRAARAGTLATAIDGQPFASLVTPATAPDASLLLLLSDLSEHTRHLRVDGRCAVMVVGEADGPNAQTAPRVTITGLATIEPDPALRARWVAMHPYAAFYAGFGDFNLWRVKPEGALFVGGFARAHRLRQAELVSDAPEVWAAEAGVIAHCNVDHADALDAIAGEGSGWRMVACDADGFDLCRGDAVRRVAWPAPVNGAGAIRAALVAIVKAARERD
jgi:putative heme iron utilization protein